MEIIRQPLTEAKRYEMLRRNVKNPHLENLVLLLSLPEARRIKLDTFLYDFNHALVTTRIGTAAISAKPKKFLTVR